MVGFPSINPSMMERMTPDQVLPKLPNDLSSRYVLHCVNLVKLKESLCKKLLVDIFDGVNYVGAPRRTNS